MPPVEAAEARLHVRKRHVGLGRNEGSGQGRVRVSVDEDDIRPPIGQDRFEADEHRSGLLGVRASADAEHMVGRWEPEFAVEAAGQVIVVVLAGVDEDLLVARAQHGRQFGGLDQLRPRADNADNSHGHRLAFALRQRGACR